MFSQDSRRISIAKNDGEIRIDGVLDEAIWSKAEKQGDFYQNFPSDTSYALSRTDVMVAFDESFIYVAAILHDEIDGNYVIQSLKRDYSYPISDAFAVFIDPLNDGLNGFSFSVNPRGAQREGLVQEGGNFGVTTAWDNKWFSAVTTSPSQWVVEMAIPYKTIRYKSDQLTWGINFSRNDLKRNENSSWSPVPTNFNIASLAYTGEMVWPEYPPEPGTNLSVIPYGSARFDADYESGDNGAVKADAGFDAKVAVTSSLNLDLTVNPDFSQVEVDRQVTNLSRFSLFFPERRQFFIENSDLFAQFGFRQIRPFFSRRIGLNSGQPVPILAGARLSGKINPKWRIGLLNMQTEGDGAREIRPENYSVGVVQRQLWSRSFLGAIFVNRQGFSGNTPDSQDYNRVAGLDFNLKTADNKWQGKVFYHHSLSPGSQHNNFAHASWLMRNSRRVFAMWNHEYVGHNYRADVGFVPRVENYNPERDTVNRRSYWRFEPMFEYKFYPEKGIINRHSAGIYLSEYLDSKFNTTERLLSLGYNVTFRNNATIESNVNQTFVKLFFDTDITFQSNDPIPAGGYWGYTGSVSFNSSPQKLFTYAAAVDYGDYFLGSKLTASAEIGFRKQPWGQFAVAVQQNEITLPAPYQSTSLTLVGPRIELSFTRSLFLSTFVQYNTQIDNVNINARFQYRFRPMSDLFIVYTDNYTSTNLGVKNRALVLKLVYWINT